MIRAALLRLMARSRGFAAALILHVIIAAFLLTRPLVSPITAIPDPLLVEIVELPGPEDETESGPEADTRRDESETSNAAPLPNPAPDIDETKPLASETPVVSLDLPSTEVTQSPVTGQVRGPDRDSSGSEPVSHATLRTVRALMCARLSPSQRVNCPEQKLDDVTIAELVADARNAEVIYARYSQFTPPPSTKREARNRQLTAYAERPVRAGLSNTGLDEGALLNAYPDPLWDGYRDPSWNDD